MAPVNIVKQVEKIARKAATAENKLLVKDKQFELANAALAKHLKDHDADQRKIDAMWAEVKQTLIDAGYTDVIENESFRISVSKTFGFKVPDAKALPKEFSETVLVPKTDKIKEHHKLYNELPKGAVDNSFYRLNKKVK
jgi:hypothetical protein